VNQLLPAAVYAYTRYDAGADVPAASAVTYPLRWRTNADGTVSIKTSENWSTIRATPDLTKVLGSVVQRWLPTLQKESARTGVPLPWLAAIATAESGGDPTAVSPAGATGLFQLMPQWWRGHSQAEMKDGPRSAAYGADLLTVIRGSQKELPVVASIYNAGGSGNPLTPHKVTGSESFPWGMVENKGYISKVVALNNEAIAHGLGNVTVTRSGLSAGPLGLALVVGAVFAIASK
jgi:soluble lytic murein transglycosylase-like protein